MPIAAFAAISPLAIILRFRCHAADRYHECHTGVDAMLLPPACLLLP